MSQLQCSICCNYWLYISISCTPFCDIQHEPCCMVMGCQNLRWALLHHSGVGQHLPSSMAGAKCHSCSIRFAVAIGYTALFHVHHLVAFRMIDAACSSLSILLCCTTQELVITYQAARQVLNVRAAMLSYCATGSVPDCDARFPC